METCCIPSARKDRAGRKWRVLFALPLWFALYLNLAKLADLAVFGLLKMTPGSRFAETLRFFLFEVPKVLMLLVLIVFAVGIIRTYFSPERTRRLLRGKSLFAGNVMAGALGIVTPFCSCSAI